MEPELWLKVEQLYHAALEREPGERPAFLKEASGADEALVREVEELLGYQKQSEDFIEAPALEIAAQQGGKSDLIGRVRGVLRSAFQQSSVSHFPFRLSSGAKLGPYEILEPLGAGGMGEIYRARDGRLGRIVALKILAARMMDQGGNRVRFEHEARAISSLNHPNICILYDIGRDGEIDYLVMEYVEGETLAERLKRGALSLPDLLHIAVEISEALDYAHRCGVIHRDLKPGNIMLSGRGAKLVDFGLARWREEAEEIAATAPADGNSSLTMTDMVLGTPQYMAPEQIDCREANARTDVFALGVVIFEMATGHQAFEGTTRGETIDAVRAGEQTRLEAIQPAALKRVVRRCLKKSPKERWQSAGDLAEELTRIKKKTTRRTSAKFRALITAVVVVLALVVGAWALRTIDHRVPEITDQVLYSFTGQNGDGVTPAASVVAGRNGILYGTTRAGGAYGKGTVFELSPPVLSGSGWTRRVLHSFGRGGDASEPITSLVIGESGALYGTARGGISGLGAVFELRPPSTLGGSWRERVLHSFSTQKGDGSEPRSELVIGRDLATGKSGALYGTTVYGGVRLEDGRGIVFELIPPDLPEGTWTEKVLHRFTGANGDGAFPYGAVVIGEGGALYGTTFGGPTGTATVFKLTPPAIGDGDWEETVLHTFAEQPRERVGPVAGLAMGEGGELYGTTHGVGFQEPGWYIS